MATEETEELSVVDFEIFGQSYRAYETESAPRDFILKVARYVDLKMHTVLDKTHSVTTLDASTREHLAVRAALDIAEEYHLAKEECLLVKAALEESERTVEPRLSNRERRARHYTRRSHEHELLALLNNSSLAPEARHEVLRDLARLRGYYRAPAKRNRVRKLGPQ